MLDIKKLREDATAARESLKKRGNPEAARMLEGLIESDAEFRKQLQVVEELRAQRNKVTHEIKMLKKQGADDSEALRRAKEIPGKIKEAEEKAKAAQVKARYFVMRVPNVLDESVPIGASDEDNVVERKWGEVKHRKFELKPHGELMEELGIGDFKRAAKTSGAGFVFVKGALALMDLALQRFAIDSLLKKGFELVEPPLMMRREIYEGVTDLADFESVMYKIDGEDSYLTATSEHPLMGMYYDEILEREQLPLKLCGASVNFRREIGAHGIDTKGLFRMHQFNKIEQVVLCEPKDSAEWFDKLVENCEELFQQLEIPYRVVSVCTGDIGTVAAKKQDVEAWMPREEKYKEVGSISNCTDYQANRLKIRYRKTFDDKEAVHSLNGTAIATSRAMRAILENYQNTDGSVTVPEALRDYMGGIEKISR
ncbi:MAG: serine--tRNA ligase [Candidatus Micrarchaeota archaeon]